MGKEDYKNEKKGHGFLCVPKELLFDNRYKQLTIEAILLYAYMLDRLSIPGGFVPLFRHEDTANPVGTIPTFRN